MKEKIKIASLILVILILGAKGLFAQDRIVGTAFGTNDWVAWDVMAAHTATGVGFMWTGNANGTGNQYWRFAVQDDPWPQQGPDGGCAADAEITVNGTHTSMDDCSSKAFFTNVSSTAHNYVLRTTGQWSRKCVLFCVQGTIRSISTVAKSPATVCRYNAVTVTATLDGALSTGQGAYVRYTTDGWTSSTIVELSFVSGSDYAGTIPAQTEGTSVSYYCFTSGNGLTITPVTDADWYTINLNNNSGSNYSYTVVTVTESAGADDVICKGQENASLTATGGGTYNWSAGLGTNANVTPSPTTSTLYTVTVTNSGCTDTDDALVTVNSVPTTTAGSDSPKCEGETLNLTSSTYTSYNWAGPNSFSSTSEDPTRASLVAGDAGTYTVTATDANGCTDSDETVVAVNAKPAASAGVDDCILSGNAASLTATGGGTYNWSAGLGTNAAVAPSPTTNTTYTVTVTNASSCTDTDQTVVKIVSAGADDVVCSGSSASLTATGGGTYLWNAGLGTNASVAPSPTTTTTYTVTVTNGTCNESDIAVVTVNALPTTTAGSDSPKCEGETLNLTSSTFTSYNWSGPSSFSSTAEDPTRASLTTAHSGTYTVTATDANGCTDTDETVVVVNVIPTVATNPSDATIASGSNTSFSMTTGDSPGFQWQVSTNHGSSWSNQADGGVYSNMTTATMSMTGATTAGQNANQYRCAITNAGCATAYTTAAELIITETKSLSLAGIPASAVDGTIYFRVLAINVEDAAKYIQFDNVDVSGGAVKNDFLLYESGSAVKTDEAGSSIVLSNVDCANPLEYAVTSPDGCRVTGSFEYTVLPVTLYYFGVKWSEETDHMAILDWTTASENNNARFEIERSCDGTHWEKIGEKPGAGNSNHLVYYTFADPRPCDQVSYYRLKQIDYDGQSEYSPPQALLRTGSEIEIISIYPNPARETIFITIISDREQDYLLNLVSTLGQQQVTQPIHIYRGSNEYTINLQHLAPATYVTRLISKDGSVKTNRLFVKE